MTEFDVGAFNGVAGRQFDLCKTDGDLSDCKGDHIGSSGGYPCGTMTDGGNFLLFNDKMFKLGSCGLEKIEYSGPGGPGLLCGKVPGGSIFCQGKDCIRYHDVDGSWEEMPQMNQDCFQKIFLKFQVQSSDFGQKFWKFLKTKTSIIVAVM